jgi:hypothetical protein
VLKQKAQAPRAAQEYRDAHEDKLRNMKKLRSLREAAAAQVAHHGNSKP